MTQAPMAQQHHVSDGGTSFYLFILMYMCSWRGDLIAVGSLLLEMDSHHPLSCIL